MMKIENAKYFKIEIDDVTMIKCVIDGLTMSVPLDENNRHYAEIKRQVDAGELTIEDAD